MKERRVLHLIKTTSYYSDGRLLKWINSLDSKGWTSDVFILEDKNSAERRFESNHEINSVRLLSRRIFKKGKGYLFKIPEFSIKSLRFIKESKASILVFHDVQHYLTLLLLLFNKKEKTKIVWDLHELPHSVLLNNFVFRHLIKLIVSRVDFVVHTNEHRQAFLYQKLDIKKDNGVVLNNFSEAAFINAEKRPLPKDLAKALNGKRYILWLGVASERRNFLQFYNAAKPYLDKLALVIIGKFDPAVKKIIEQDREFTSVYQNFVKHNEIINYIDNALFSVVLYKNVNPNNFFCEPNRLYQLISRCIPVIGGNNPQIVDTIKKCGGGILLSDDGSTVGGIDAAINDLLSDTSLEKIRRDLTNYDFLNHYSWEVQFGEVFDFITSKIEDDF